MNGRSFSLVALAAAALAAAGLSTLGRSAESVRPAPAPALDEAQPSAPAKETAVIAGGCFWGVQGVFQHVKGVINAVSGYAGGDKSTAEYETVSGGETGHAESVRITFDPSQITYGRILQIYFSVAHDPTELNRQGPDVGTQYRSAIFPQNADQTRIAKAYIAQIDQARVFDAAVVTRIELGRQFFPAEAYHQDYLTLHPNQPYIAFNDIPKIAALKNMFPEVYRADPVLVANAGLSN